MFFNLLLADVEHTWYGLAWVFQLLLLAVVVWIVWRLLRGTPAFRIRVAEGTLHVVSGKLRPTLLSNLNDVVIQAGVSQGTITGHNQAGRIVLKFSREFSPAVQQQIRNTWYSSY